MRNNNTNLLAYAPQTPPDAPARLLTFDRLRAVPDRLWIAAAAMAAMALFGLDAALRIWGGRAFDDPVILAVNLYAARSHVVDLALKALAGYDLFQGMPLVALAVGAFAAAGGRGRTRLMIGGVGAAGAAVASRLIQLFLPSLPRPLYDPALPFHLPYGSECAALRDWSSFPSDHAALLFGVAVATLVVNRRIGVLSLAIAAASSLARLYYGLHYATDLIGGALLGAAAVCALVAIALPWEDRLLAFARPRPALIATVAFLFAAQAASLFDEVRQIALSTAHQVKEMREPRLAASPAQDHGAGLRRPDRANSAAVSREPGSTSACGPV